MKICLEQFLSPIHSWGSVGLGMARALIKKGHDISLKSTNGYSHFPEDLKPYIKDKLDNSFAMCISYTAPKNFPIYLSHSNKNRFGIWNYEFTKVDPSFIKYYKSCDKFLPSSNFSKEIFAKNGIPENHMQVVPHGFDGAKYLNNTEIYPLKTRRKLKFGAVLQQMHGRKHLDGLLKTYARSFKQHDDVCLILKVNPKQPSAPFEIDFFQVMANFKKQFPNHADIEIITEFIPKIETFYKAIDVHMTMTYAECFHFPSLEAMASGNIVISPRYGGQLDFLNDSNSILIEGKMIQAPVKFQYWTPSPLSEMFEPSIDDAVSKLQYVADHHIELKEKFKIGAQEVISKYTWDNVADQILNLAQ